MNHKVLRSVLTILLAVVAVFDIARGILVLTGVYAPPVNYYGTLFNDATVPMLLVAIVVGGSALLAAATVFIHREWALLVSLVAGLMMDGYLVVERLPRMGLSAFERTDTQPYSGCSLVSSRHSVGEDARDRRYDFLEGAYCERGIKPLDGCSGSITSGSVASWSTICSSIHSRIWT